MFETVADFKAWAVQHSAMNRTDGIWAPRCAQYILLRLDYSSYFAFHLQEPSVKLSCRLKATGFKNEFNRLSKRCCLLSYLINANWFNGVNHSFIRETLLIHCENATYPTRGRRRLTAQTFIHMSKSHLVRLWHALFSMALSLLDGL